MSASRAAARFPTAKCTAHFGHLLMTGVISGRCALVSQRERWLTVGVPSRHAPLYASTRISPFRITLRSRGNNVSGRLNLTCTQASETGNTHLDAAASSSKRRSSRARSSSRSLASLVTASWEQQSASEFRTLAAARRRVVLRAPGARLRWSAQTTARACCGVRAQAVVPLRAPAARARLRQREEGRRWWWPWWLSDAHAAHTP